MKKKKKPWENILLMQVTFCIYLYSHAHVFGVNNSLFNKLANVAEARYSGRGQFPPSVSAFPFMLYLGVPAF